MRDYAAQGYLPEALVNFFALMGWYPEDGRELFTVPEMIARFRIEEMGKSGAVFDIHKLNWMNGVYMQRAYQRDPNRVVELVIAALWKEGLLNGELSPEQRAYVFRVVAIMGERLRLPQDVVTYGDFFFRDVAHGPQAVPRYQDKPEEVRLLRSVRDALGALDTWTVPEIETAVRGAAAQLGVEAKVIIHLLRMALTGKTVGPGLFELIDVLGKPRVLERLERASS